MMGAGTGILGRFWPRRAPAPAFGGAAPAPEAPFWAIGDVHGRADLLGTLLAGIAREAPGETVVCVGDYVDRGEHSAEALALLQAESMAGRVICLLGNHEEMMLEFCRGGGTGWLRHGGLQTMASFGLGAGLAETCDAAVLDAARAALSEVLEARGLAAWLEELPRVWQSGNVAVTHAGADPARPPAGQKRSLTWGHPDFFRLPRADGLWVVHGHYMREMPELEPGRIGIDTGAYATGRLTAVRLAAGEPPRFVEA